MAHKLPNITTKTGDGGTSKLWSGETLPKDDFRFALVGKIDTLSAQIGICKATARLQPACFTVSEIIDSLSKIQTHLFRLMGEIATTESKWEKYYKNNKPITDVDIDYLDKAGEKIKLALEGKNYKIDGWILYGDESLLSAHLDMASKLCREAEVELYGAERQLSFDVIESEKEFNDMEIFSNWIQKFYRKQLKTYINRLSDYLYWMARLAA